jgi:DamX protein
MRLAFRRSNDSADSPPYLPLLKLHTSPFATRAGSSFFYADAERTQYLDMLQHLTQYSEELLLVVGTEGIGKSALLEKYLERSEDHWRLCRLNGEQGIDLKALFARVAECFAVELATVEPTQLLAALSQHLDSLLEQQLSVLLIDDAHGLSDDALEMVLHLAALEGEHGKLIRVLMFADSAIETRIASPRFAQAATPHRLELKPLQEADSSAYLLHRLQQAGYSGSSPFSAAELKQLHRQAQGVPAQLNQAAHSLLLQRLKGDVSRFGLSANGIRMGVAATALIGTVLGMHDRINATLGGVAESSMTPTLAVRPTPAIAALETQQVMEELPVKETEVIAQAPVTEPPVADEPAMRAVQVSSPSEPRSNVQRFQVEATKKKPVAKKPVTKQPTAAKDGKIQQSSWIAAQPAGNFTLQLLVSNEPEALPEFVAKHPALKGPLGRFEQQRGDKRMHVLTQGSYPNRAQAEAAAKGLPDILQSWIRDFAGIKKVMAQPSRKAIAPEVTSSGGIKDTAWVWSQNPNQYTIQLAGGVDEAAIEAVMRGSSLPGELAVVQTLRNGKPWYVLVYGRFASKAAAQDTAVRLPAPLKKAGPWIRQFSALQDEIGQATAR